MDANRFFSVPYDNRNDVKMRRLRKRLDGYAGYGRWVALLGMLYDEKGILDMSDAEMVEIVCEELELDDADHFFTVLADIGLIDKELYHSMNHVVNRGVLEQIEFRVNKANAGKKSGEARRNRDTKKR